MEEWRTRAITPSTPTHPGEEKHSYTGRGNVPVRVGDVHSRVPLWELWEEPGNVNYYSSR